MVKSQFNFMDNLIPTRLHKPLQYLVDGISVNSTLGKGFFPAFRQYYVVELEQANALHGEPLNATAPGSHYHLDRLNYVITRLETIISEGNLFNNQDAYIFLDSLVYRISEYERIKLEG